MENVFGIHTKTEMCYTFSNVKSFCYYFWKLDGTYMGLYKFVQISYDLIITIYVEFRELKLLKFKVKKLRWRTTQIYSLTKPFFDITPA